MRDRLVELLLNVDYALYTDERKARDSAEFIADYLLANDVIVLPCKVGDTVYRLNSICSCVNEATVKAVYYTEDKKYYPKSHIIIQYDLHRGRTRVNFCEFGKTVFLTREEAEKALKGYEGDENNKEIYKNL